MTIERMKMEQLDRICGGTTEEFLELAKIAEYGGANIISKFRTSEGDAEALADWLQTNVGLSRVVINSNHGTFTKAGDGKSENIYDDGEDYLSHEKVVQIARRVVGLDT